MSGPDTGGGDTGWNQDQNPRENGSVNQDSSYRERGRGAGWGPPYKRPHMDNKGGRGGGGGEGGYYGANRWGEGSRQGQANYSIDGNGSDSSYPKGNRGSISRGQSGSGAQGNQANMSNTNEPRLWEKSESTQDRYKGNGESRWGGRRSEDQWRGGDRRESGGSNYQNRGPNYAGGNQNRFQTPPSMTDGQGYGTPPNTAGANYQQGHQTGYQMPPAWPPGAPSAQNPPQPPPHPPGLPYGGMSYPNYPPPTQQMGGFMPQGAQGTYPAMPQPIKLPTSLPFNRPPPNIPMNFAPPTGVYPGQQHPYAHLQTYPGMAPPMVDYSKPPPQIPPNAAMSGAPQPPSMPLPPNFHIPPGMPLPPPPAVPYPTMPVAVGGVYTPGQPAPPAGPPPPVDALSLNRQGTGSRRPPHPQDAWGSGSVDQYEIIEKIGEGMYGHVYKAKSKKDASVVALKRVRLEIDHMGFPLTAIREVKLLRRLSHPNIVALKDIVSGTIDSSWESSGAAATGESRLEVFMVFEYLDHDLTGLLESGEIKLSENQVRHFLRQILQGLEYCHAQKILHRDIKGSNVLVNSRGDLKLADFGLARNFVEEERAYTNRVITLWYRPPELILGEDHYGTAVDIWSTGCILGELFFQKPIFQGRDEVHQMELICKVCGTPRERDWPNASDLPLYRSLMPKMAFRRQLTENFGAFMPSDALSLMERLLTMDPRNRPSAREALQHPYFANNSPFEPLNLKTGNDYHEYKTRLVKKQAAENAQNFRPPQFAKPPTSTQNRGGFNENAGRNSGNMPDDRQQEGGSWNEREAGSRRGTEDLIRRTFDPPVHR